MCKSGKSDYYKTKINDCAKDQKSLFKFTNELMHRQRDASLPTHDNPLSLANNFAQFFVEKIEMISQTFTDSIRSESINSHMSVPEITEFQTVSEEDLKKVIIKGNSKCCHLDPIPTTLLKECIDLLIPSLTQIVNTLLKTCSFPESCKFATLVPLLKKSSLDKDVLN